MHVRHSPGAFCFHPTGFFLDTLRAGRQVQGLLPLLWGGNVKTNLTTDRSNLAPDGLGSQSRETAFACRACRSAPGWRITRCDLSQSGVESCVLRSGFPEDYEALLFSTIGWEPSFYWGLYGPWLPSALRGGIAYALGLRGTRPGAAMMLSRDSDSSLGTAPSRFNSVPICDTAPEPSYVVFLSFAGS